VKKGLRIADFNILTMPERIEQEKDLFTGVLGEGINMEEAIANLS
jgi:bifunctional non-homologous end joining protein LigD